MQIAPAVRLWRRPPKAKYIRRKSNRRRESLSLYLAGSMVDVHEHLVSDEFSVLKIRARYARRLALERRQAIDGNVAGVRRAREDASRLDGNRFETWECLSVLEHMRHILRHRHVWADVPMPNAGKPRMLHVRRAIAKPSAATKRKKPTRDALLRSSVCVWAPSRASRTALFARAPPRLYTFVEDAGTNSESPIYSDLICEYARALIYENFNPGTHAVPADMTRAGSMLFDEDGDAAHEFFLVFACCNTDSPHAQPAPFRMFESINMPSF